MSINMERKLKLRESIYILKESEDVYQVIFTSTRRVKRFSVDGLVKQIIGTLLNGEQTINNLLKGLSKEFGAEDIAKCIGALESEGIIKS